MTMAANLLGIGFEGAQRIPVNMYETTDAVVIVAPMPGIGPDDVEITVEGWRVHLRAEQRTPARKPYLLHEWEYGPYERWVDLPEAFRGGVIATLGNGQLAMRIERCGERQPAESVRVRPVAAPRPTT